ncbi:uroporphyrinogen-III C-methyltransferase [Alteromonas sp. 1_MG-2023]|uniref:uroporphyrinogen-III C-methyltransferase n=1 Tax=Alteromonas sp. 1_MG-2023 TaxID=3062669 RepID=UPI0026E20870|nr:uroporphyrinogen-III C-methyltransferase [Alteromonas sp. 1_MG-2023]MDO6565727.1 uroporphyrinogen-III C-methyltransferase [Alteromonas sp. 1_MG-2023]
MNILANKFQLLFRENLSHPVRQPKTSFFSGLLGGDKNRKTNESEGKVYIVGAGPGDVELLTLKALRLIKQADIVLFDALVGEDVIAEIPRHVKREYVGKRCGKHSMKQQDISTRVVELAKAGLCVVRLKGGDPALFARTCEETIALTQANIPFAIVPGITAASGMSAYTGIPLTDRRCAQAVSFITAHFQNPEKWPDMVQLAKNVASQTVVVYMGLSRLSTLCEELKKQGIADDWPVAAVENATSPQQRVIEGTLNSISEQVSQANVSGPTLLIFGKVIESRQWVDTSLLHNKQHVSAI